MSNYAIFRCKKLKSNGEISASSSHMMRTRPTPNADPTKKNKILIGSDDPAVDVETRLSDTTQRRKNSVLTIEVLLTVSPEWFSTATKSQKNEWMKKSQTFLSDHFGEENLVHLQLHLDESTPHLTGFIVPIDLETGRLNSAKWTDGSAKLAAMQDAYYNAISHLGIIRGSEGSDATHEEMKHLHAAARKELGDVDTPKIPIPPFMVKDKTRQDWVESAEKEIASSQSESIELLKNQARSGLLATKKLKQYQANADRFRLEASKIRDIPLLEIAEKLGLERDKYDLSKYRDKLNSHSISINGNKFFDHKEEKGGSGAIDLIIHCTGWDYKQVISWMGHEIGVHRTAGAVGQKAVTNSITDVEKAMTEKAPFAPPVKSEHLRIRHQVANYLTQERCISPKLLKDQSSRNTIYADTRGNAVFKAIQSDGTVLGAEVRGTGERAFHGLASGSNKDFCFEVRTESPSPTLPKLVLVESAIDALSFAQLHPGENLIVASTAGSRSTLPKSLETRLSDVSEVVIALDNDQVGNRASNKLLELLRALGKQVSRLIPPIGKDWNDTLRANSKSEKETGKVLDTFFPISPTTPK